jgi:ABC-type Fe3+/spermidine/putrescine transport system ATPase subunit
VSLLVRDLSASYGTKHAHTQALRGVSLSINTAERFAVMGPSGSGKTTLLRAIAGLAPIDAGVIEIDGQNMTNTPAHQRPVGFMFQDYALFPHMSVIQNVGYGLRMAGVSAATRNERGHDLLELVGLGGFADRNPATLSGGEQQRVALARTLAPEPSVVLLDEPLGSLDISLRESLLAETGAILDGVGTTSVYVTHDSSEAFSFCDRMAIVREGKIVRVGTPDEIWLDPGSELTARAIGQSNLIPISALMPGRSGIGYLPLDAVDVNPTGRLSGIAKSSRFEEGRHILSVELPDSSATLEMKAIEPTQLGSSIRFDIRPGELIVVSVDEV